ncbi:MAG: imidazole glycerol phosphate synthase subunit HisH [Spirochaetales bacterium]|nr:imidazole glycerol phosphate synthase subunit HisH [Spirochaetales bacterium]
MKVGIVNYGMGNLASVRRAFEDLGVEVRVAQQPGALYEVDKIVLPGVGAFADGMRHLREHAWDEAIRELVGRGTPMLGICLGMQMLASHGEEGGGSPGLDLVPGMVIRLDQLGCTERIPHVGWNELHYAADDPIFNGIPDASDFYFVHSFGFQPANQADAIGHVPYGPKITAVVKHGSVIGCQFHPEKSSKAGRRLLQNFLEWKPC